MRPLVLLQRLGGWEVRKPKHLFFENLLLRFARLGGLVRRLVCFASNQGSRWLSRMANSGQGGEEVGRLGDLVMVEDKEKKVEVIEDDEDEEEGLPDAATAKKLIKEFETVTNTDEIMAQYQLQVKF